MVVFRINLIEIKNNVMEHMVKLKIKNSLRFKRVTDNK